MKGNPTSIKPLNESGKVWLQKVLQLLQVQEIRNWKIYKTSYIKIGVAEHRIAKSPEPPLGAFASLGLSSIRHNVMGRFSFSLQSN